MGDNSVLHKDRQSRKHIPTVGGNILEPKRIMLLGMTLIGSDRTWCEADFVRCRRLDSWRIQDMSPTGDDTRRRIHRV